MNWKDLRVRFVCENEFEFCVPVWLVGVHWKSNHRKKEEKKITKREKRTRESGKKSERIKSGIQPNGKRHKIAIKAVASKNPLCMYIQKCFKWIKYIWSERMSERLYECEPVLEIRINSNTINKSDYVNSYKQNLSKKKIILKLNSFRD